MDSFGRSYSMEQCIGVVAPIRVVRVAGHGARVQNSEVTLTDVSSFGLVELEQGAPPWRDEQENAAQRPGIPAVTESEVAGF